jgi:ribosomal subunit interface protein
MMLSSSLKAAHAARPVGAAPRLAVAGARSASVVVAAAPARPAIAAPAPLLSRRRRASPPPPHASAPSSAASAAAVKINIQGRRLPVTPSIRDYVEEKVAKAVAHFSADVRRIDVTLSARGGDTGTHGPKAQKVDVTIHTERHGVVRVEDSEGSLYASIDVVCDKVARKLRKVKELAMAKGTWARGRAGARRDGAQPGAGELDEGADDVTLAVAVDSVDETDDVSAAERAASPLSGLPEAVARVKSVPCPSMSVADAADALEALGHGFYLFKEEKTQRLAVVYRRESGGYGVLVPQ